MKISTKYLKLLIKEEIKKINEGEQLKQKTIIMSPQQFLDLTTTPQIMDELQKRFKNLKYDPFTKAMESPNLVLDQNGKVINHEGRLRAFILNNNKINTYEVKVYYPSKFDIEETNLMLFNQFDDEKSTTINKVDNNDNISIPNLSGIYDSRLKINDILYPVFDYLSKTLSRQDVVSTLNNELDKYSIFEIENDKRNENKILKIRLKSKHDIQIYNPNAKFYYPYPTDKKIELVKQ